MLVPSIAAIAVSVAILMNGPFAGSRAEVGAPHLCNSQVVIHDFSESNGPAWDMPSTIILFVSRAEAACKCKATTADMPGSVKLWQCAADATKWAQIKVTSPSAPVSPDCNEDCETSPRACIARVKGELVVPDGCLTNPGSVVGPGLGTTHDPCVDVINDETYTATWNLSAPCGSVTSFGEGAWMEFRTNGCSDPKGDPVMKYAPRLTCAKCSE